MIVIISQTTFRTRRHRAARASLVERQVDAKQVRSPDLEAKVALPRQFMGPRDRTIEQALGDRMPVGPRRIPRAVSHDRDKINIGQVMSPRSARQTEENFSTY